MASGFFAILDDIAALMDDVAMTTKLATKKTAGILGDDLAVNAEKATGFLSSRELPVLWAITKGSFINKLIILPIIFLLNWLFPIAIKVILVIGGLYLAYEGVEKIIEYFFHKNDYKTEHEEALDVMDDPIAAEKAKVKSAITTDFILSLEIVIIALSSALDQPLLQQILTVTLVSIIATVGVYGIVALIVRMDDAGYKLQKKSKKEGGILFNLGQLLINMLPWVIKILGVVGTIALLLVAGGIFLHNVEYLHHLVEDLPTPAIVNEFGAGILGGIIMVLVITLVKKIISLFKK
ncbi:DUF808 domain-containing protein [Cloacibacterium sp. TD35]|uniref:DUF808 domain-containing protein n=1 Tax=Cloacibacterium sp. TD35 TaxID=2976818 RepID=UPI00237DB717|nr:DUF808 family protein [Cloacibacterium sp. TD35]WDT67012.1 DUF808 domain-containing protein [Cloacibacterium sp. TD35]